VERIEVVFEHMFEPRIDGCELNHGHHGHFIDDGDIRFMKSLEGQVGLLKGIMGPLMGSLKCPCNSVSLAAAAAIGAQRSIFFSAV
jgi:hypothetical protein